MSEEAEGYIDVSRYSEPSALRRQDPRCEAFAADANGYEQRCNLLASDHPRFRHHHSASGLQWPVVPALPGPSAPAEPEKAQGASRQQDLLCSQCGLGKTARVHYPAAIAFGGQHTFVPPADGLLVSEPARTENTNAPPDGMERRGEASVSASSSGPHAHAVTGDMEGARRAEYMSPQQFTAMVEEIIREHQPALDYLARESGAGEPAREPTPEQRDCTHFSGIEMRCIHCEVDAPAPSRQGTTPDELSLMAGRFDAAKASRDEWRRRAETAERSLAEAQGKSVRRPDGTSREYCHHTPNDSCDSDCANQASDIEAAAAVSPQSWRCFHCDEVFTEKADAVAHFGPNEWAEAACVIQRDRGLVASLREVETRNQELLHRAQEAEYDAEGYAGLRSELKRYFGAADAWTCWNRMDEKEGARLAAEERAEQALERERALREAGEKAAVYWPRFVQRAVMEAIERTIVACDADEKAKLPHEARSVDYAGILATVLAFATAATPTPSEASSE